MNIDKLKFKDGEPEAEFGEISLETDNMYILLKGNVWVVKVSDLNFSKPKRHGTLVSKKVANLLVNKAE